MVCCTYFNIKEVGCRCFGPSVWAFIFWLQFWLHFQILGEFLFIFLVPLVPAKIFQDRLTLAGKVRGSTLRCFTWSKH
jgi:hypothetical protein